MDTEGIHRRVQHAWTRQRWDDWRATCAASYRFHPTPAAEFDLAQTLAWNRAWFGAFPDYRERVRAVYPARTAVAYELVGTGTSQGDLTLFGQTLIPHAPGRTFELEYVKVLVVDADGLVQEDRQYLDPAALLDQLGAHRLRVSG